jgi:hypothetical protein
MEPGDRVTFKMDKRIRYGTVIPYQFRTNKNKESKLIFVVWDSTPDKFYFYDVCEIRKVRKDEEEYYKEVQ